MWEKLSTWIMINVSLGMILFLGVFMLLITNRILTIVNDTFPDIEVIETDSNE